MPIARPDPGLLTARLAGHSRVALAVSGGSDSMAMLRLAAGSASCTFMVLTVDHALRPGSADEARQVSQWCAGLGLPHLVLQWTGSRPGNGLQARARKARYDLMTAWCVGNGASALVTAHTLDDQAETVLMRLLRTESFDSIAGIPAIGEWQGVPLVRPLLTCRRADLQAYLATVGQAWIEDPSNKDTRFERVRLRQFLPELVSSGITPERLAALAESCAAMAGDIARQSVMWCRDYLQQQPGLCSFAADSFERLPLVVRVRILGDLIYHFGGGGRPERAELERLARAIAVAGPMRRTLGGALIWRRRHAVLIGREPGRIDASPVAVPAAGEILWDKRYQVTAPPGSQVLPVRVTAIPRPSRDVPDTVFRSQPIIRLADRSLVLGQAGPGSAVTARFLPFASV